MTRTGFATHDIGHESRTRNPHTSWCRRCGISWNEIRTEDYHYIKYRKNDWCFPTCQACWDKSSLQERLEFGQELVDRWERDYQKYRYMWDGLPAEDYALKRREIEREIRREWDEEKRKFALGPHTG